jgi:HEAT repeat protein
MKRFAWVLVLALAWGLRPPKASAVIEVIPTLGQVIRDATHIVVLEVEKVSVEKRVIIYKKLADLKGTHPTERVHHQISNGLSPRDPKIILDWATPGKIAVWFHNGTVSQTCIGQYWYESYALKEAPWWAMVRGTGYFCSVYFGSADKLRRAVTDMLQDKEVIVTMSSADGQMEYYRGAELKNYFRAGQFNVYRLRASLKLAGNYMPLMVAGKLDVKRGAAGPEDLPRLFEALKHPDPRVRAEAADDLWLTEPNPKDAVGPLTAALGDPELEVRLSAARALARSDPAGKAGLSVLSEALKEKSGSLRRRAVETLGSLGKGARTAVPDLVAALLDPDASVRWSAADALGQIGPEAKAAVPALVETLRDPYLRGVAVEALGEIGPEARSAAPAILAALRDEDPAVSRMAAIALLQVGAEQKAAARVIVERIKNTQEHVSIGPKLRNHGALGIDSERNVESEYDFFSLCRYFSRSNAALSAVAEVLVEVTTNAREDLAFRRRCAFWLPHLSAHAPKPALASLRETLGDMDELIRTSAAGTLLALQPDLEQTMPDLADVLLKKAQVEGKYTGLLKRIKAPRDYENPQIRLFCDRGFSEHSLLADQKDLRRCRWVYVYPCWYVWAPAGEGK